MGLETGLILLAASTLIAGTTTAVVSNQNAIAAKNQASDAQAANLAAAKAAANKATAATTGNVGTVALQSEEDLQDEAIRSRSTKNRLRVDRTGLSLGSPTTAQSTTGLRI